MNLDDRSRASFALYILSYSINVYKVDANLLKKHKNKDWKQNEDKRTDRQSDRQTDRQINKVFTIGPLLSSSSGTLMKTVGEIIRK